jgi:hypothetical protein
MRRRAISLLFTVTILAALLRLMVIRPIGLAGLQSYMAPSASRCVLASHLGSAKFSHADWRYFWQGYSQWCSGQEGAALSLWSEIRDPSIKLAVVGDSDSAMLHVAVVLVSDLIRANAIRDAYVLDAMKSLHRNHYFAAVILLGRTLPVESLTLDELLVYTDAMAKEGQIEEAIHVIDATNIAMTPIPLVRKLAYLVYLKDTQGITAHLPLVKSRWALFSPADRADAQYWIERAGREIDSP